MNPPQIDPRKAAATALALMSRATITCDDQSLSDAAAARVILGAIANGQLMLVPTPPPPATINAQPDAQ